MLLQKRQNECLAKTANEGNRILLHEAVTLVGPLRDRTADPSIPY
jgi:hypothetical protein